MPAPLGRFSKSRAQYPDVEYTLLPVCRKKLVNLKSRGARLLYVGLIYSDGTLVTRDGVANVLGDNTLRGARYVKGSNGSSFWGISSVILGGTKASTPAGPRREQSP